MDKVPFYMFILALALIFLAYYAGLATDLGAATNLTTSVWNTATGRNPSGGPFQNYPGNAPATANG